MRFPTNQEIQTLYGALPEKLRRAIDEERTASLIYDICDRYETTDEDIEVFTTFTGYVLFGVLPIRDFFSEVNVYLDATDTIATEIAREINRDLFIPLHDEIIQAERAYDAGGRSRVWKEKLSKVGAPTTDTISPQSQQTFKKETLAPTTNNTVKPYIEPSFPPKQMPSPSLVVQSQNTQDAPKQDATKPMILHESKQIESVGKTLSKRPFKSPFNLFSRKQVTRPETVSAKIQAPKENIVHYSEAHTQLNPFDKDNDVIDLELFGTPDKPNNK